MEPPPHSSEPSTPPPSDTSGAIDDLLPHVYDRLRRIAGELLGSPASATLQPTAVVHEVYLKLANSDGQRAFDREHFLCLAARAMRQVLADHARGKHTSKRGGDWRRISLSLSSGDDPSDLVLSAVDTADALERLESLDPRQAQVVEMRVFGGLTVPEVARVLGVSPRTVDTQWRIARAWLRSNLAGED